INETHAQVLSSLSAGQNVRVLEAGEGRDLLEAAGIKLQAPTTRSSDSDYVNPKRRGGGRGMSNGSGAPPGPAATDRPREANPRERAPQPGGPGPAQLRDAAPNNPAPADSQRQRPSNPPSQGH